MALDPRLEADSAYVTDLALCQVRLEKDSRFPWLILVPRRAGVSEIGELTPEDQAQLFAEILRAGDAVRAMDGVEKLNIGALGNIVRQLHVHVVGRHEGDAAWPGPVWGFGEAVPYAPGAMEARIRATKEALST